MSEEQQAEFAPGTVVQLRSGGPLITVVSTYNGAVSFIYFNTVNGVFERGTVDQRCLRGGIGKPEVPQDADRMRTTSVAKSSMS